MLSLAGGHPAKFAADRGGDVEDAGGERGHRGVVEILRGGGDADRGDDAAGGADADQR